MKRLIEWVNEFVREELGQGTTEYGSTFVLVALSIAILFVVFQGGFMHAVNALANDFVSKCDKMSIAADRQLNL